MTVKISKKQIAGLHASIDELAAANPETAMALVTIFEALMQTETAVVVPAKGKASTKKAAAKDEDDLDDDDDLDGDDDNGDDEDDLVDDGDDDLDDDEEEEDEKPTRGKGKASSKGRGKAAAKEEEEEDEDEDGEDAVSIDLDDLEAATIETAFDEVEVSETHERATGGVREMTAALDDLGLDVPSIIKAAKAKTTVEKKEALAEVLSRAHTVIDAIAEQFEFDSIVDAVAELTDEAKYKPAGRGAAAKALNAATDLFRAAITAE